MKESITAKRDSISKRKRSIAQTTGFTLVELLVVIAIIGLLMGILMPSLNKARQTAYTAKASGNMHNVALGLETFATDTGYYPPSYMYPDSATSVDPIKLIGSQDESKANGYLHWSWFLFESGRVDASAFTCPAVRSGGAPRTNPGKKLKDWEKGQADDSGNTEVAAGNKQDMQAPRMAFTANAAIIPRNKFAADDKTNQYPRHNRLVKPTEIQRPAEVILLTEFNENWKTLGVNGSNGILSKSHRPILPFTHSGTGFADYAVYEAQKDQTRFEYGTGYKTDTVSWGLQSLAKISNQDNHYLNGETGHPLNAVGRHHPGSWKATTDEGANQDMGGTTMFLYCDGHVERKTVYDTVKNLEWGKKFYSITGDQLVFY
jgi:prepilin-type N-terminal cleavage/methylation domain-containing protein/prepilin-type processing-associated H-X9-DG protein